MSQRVRKVYLSSAFRKSGTPSSFRIEIPQDVELGPDSHVAVSDCIIPHSWYNIQEGVNSKLYIRQGSTNRVVEVESGHYTASSLAARLALKLNAVAAGGTSFTVSGPTSTINKLTITEAGGSGFLVYADSVLKGDGPIGESPIVNPQSLNSYLNVEPMTAQVTSWQSGYISLLRITEVYVRSPDLAAFDTVDSMGRRDVLKKVAVDKEHGYLIVSPSTYELSDLSKVSGNLRSMHFELTDNHGNLIQMQAQDWSLSLNIVSGVGGT